MKKENLFHFGIRVDELENFISSSIADARTRLLQSTDIAVHQGLKETSVLQIEIATAIEVLKSHVNKTLNPEIEKLVQEILQSILETLKNQTAYEVGVLIQKINNIEVDVKRIKITYNWPSYYKVIVGIVALSFIDALMNYSSFQVFAKYLILAILLSIFTAIALAFSAHAIGKRMQKALTSKEKWIRFLSGIFSGGVVFYGLGLLRQAYVRDSGLLANSPIIWMLLNNFFFAIAIVLAYSMLPTKAQEQEKQLKDDKLKQIEQLKQEKSALLENLKVEENKFNECKQRLEYFRIYRNELLSKLDSEKDHLIATCVKEFTIKSGSRINRPQLLIQNPQ